MILARLLSIRCCWPCRPLRFVAVDLSTIERKIVKEPAYHSKPKYWPACPRPGREYAHLAGTGRRYVVRRSQRQRRSDGAGRKSCRREAQVPRSDDRNYTFTAGELREGGKRHLNLSVWVSDLNPGLPEAKALLERDPKARMYNVGLEVEVPGFQGLGAGGRLVQGAGSDTNGLLQFADRPRMPRSFISAATGRWVCTGRRFSGSTAPTTLTSFSALLAWAPAASPMSATRGVVPDNLAPRIEITFPRRKPGEPLVIAGYELKDRC